mgnify:CR=1 FL=1
MLHWGMNRPPRTRGRFKTNMERLQFRYHPSHRQQIHHRELSQFLAQGGRPVGVLRQVGSFVTLQQTNHDLAHNTPANGPQAFAVRCHICFLQAVVPKRCAVVQVVGLQLGLVFFGQSFNAHGRCNPLARGHFESKVAQQIQLCQRLRSAWWQTRQVEHHR